MGTIIKSVAFENFYNYYGSYEANEYQFKVGINIVNADNNMGKSKFYNGFMWMLRDIHKWRCGVRSREVFKFFNFRWRTASYAINDECF